MLQGQLDAAASSSSSLASSSSSSSSSLAASSPVAEAAAGAVSQAGASNADAGSLNAMAAVNGGGGGGGGGGDGSRDTSTNASMEQDEDGSFDDHENAAAGERMKEVEATIQKWPVEYLVGAPIAMPDFAAFGVVSSVTGGMDPKVRVQFDNDDVVEVQSKAGNSKAKKPRLSSIAEVAQAIARAVVTLDPEKVHLVPSVAGAPKFQWTGNNGAEVLSREATEGTNKRARRT